jgi:hypothetical protein
MSLTILNRIDIDIDWYFSAVSVGFTIHKRGFQLSLIFFDISVYYFSPKWREATKARYKKFQEEVAQL